MSEKLTGYEFSIKSDPDADDLSPTVTLSLSTNTASHQYDLGALLGVKNDPFNDKVNYLFQRIVGVIHELGVSEEDLSITFTGPRDHSGRARCPACTLGGDDYEERIDQIHSVHGCLMIVGYRFVTRDTAAKLHADVAGYEVTDPVVVATCRDELAGNDLAFPAEYNEGQGRTVLVMGPYC